MPVGLEEWSAGIVSIRYCEFAKVCVNIPLFEIFLSFWFSFASLYLLVLVALVVIPSSVLVALACLLSTQLIGHPHNCFFTTVSRFQGPIVCFIKLTSALLLSIILAFYLLVNCFKNLNLELEPLPRLKMLRLLQNILYFVMVGNFFLGIINIGQILSSRLFLLCAGDVELNPGPISRNLFSFFHRNLNSICARGNVKIPLIEAYNSVHHCDVLAISESMLDSSISNYDISFEGFSKEIFRNDHPSNTKTGGVCLYYREGLAIKRRKDLEILQETVVAEIHIGRKKILFCTTYRSSSQNSVDLRSSSRDYKQ